MISLNLILRSDTCSRTGQRYCNQIMQPEHGIVRYMHKFEAFNGRCQDRPLKGLEDAYNNKVGIYQDGHSTS